MQPMTHTRTLLCDSSARATTHNPTQILQSRCCILALPPFVPSPLWKQKKLNYRKPTAETALFTDAEGEKHITSYVSICRHFSHTLPHSLPFSLSIGLPFQMRDPSYTCPAAWNHVNSPLLLPLYLNKMIHFSIMAMSVWNELYNQ